MGTVLSNSIRKKLVNALLSASDDEYLSGQNLADVLGCSRTAVWKHIEDLRKLGYEVEAVKKKGYRIIRKPNQLSEEEILFGLRTSFIGRNIIHYETVDSTQIEAKKFARNQAPEGTLVIAEEQTQGRGRMAREWHSSKKKGIWMSLIIRPKLPLEKAPQFTLLTAIAVAKAIEEVTQLRPEIKWPNDILLDGKKVTGILTEVQGEPDHINYLVIGIGINVNHTQDDFPEDVRDIATSLSIQANNSVSRVALIQSIMHYFEEYYQLYVEQGFVPLKPIWEKYAISIGKEIIARTVSGNIYGKAIGITDEGVLKLADDQGNIQLIYSADIDICT